MSKSVGDCLLERLIDWGVHRVHAYPGDGINRELVRASFRDMVETFIPHAGRG